ncbi:aminopeptidase [Candidatus Woesearchaeota archaeon]|nr:aminopeptidase [Candidatus Woesearchaeota archaeon]
MNLKSNESCLIITDDKLKPIGNILYNNSLKITKKSKLILIPTSKVHGAEPPKDIANVMLKYDVILIPTTKSLSHTKARENASKKGARIASMPGITIDMMKKALNVDFYKIRKINNFLISRLKNCSKVTLKTKNSTFVEFFVRSRKWLSDDGDYTKKGAFGNLPAGEIFIAPLEGKTSGKIVVDASVGGLSKVDKDIKIDIKNGFIKNIRGEKTAKVFSHLLKNKLYKNVAELGIGTNYKAKITGNVLEDEKVAGTCHIAFGNNKHFGGKVDVPFHVDVVIKNPTIYADNTLVMEEGKINFKS